MSRAGVARRAGRAPSPLTPETRLRLSSAVAFEPAADGRVWIATVHGVPASRVSRSVVDLLTAMDGDATLQDLRLRFAASESAEGFLALVGRFRAGGLIDGESTRPPGRLVYRPPFTLQLATLRAGTLFGRLNDLLHPVSRRAVLVTVAALLAAGVVAAIVQLPDLLALVRAPVPLLGLLLVVAVLFLITLLHEGAHGITLSRFGGTPRRAGVMLFYLSPAFFVDVTDGWRLADRRQRVAVALAGPAVHAVVGAVAMTAAVVVPDQGVREILLLLGVACAVVVLVNLIPFVRFDGYIALMSVLDEPNLRTRTIRDAGSALTRLLFGGPRVDRRLDRWWSVPFGLASLVTPIVLVVFAVVRVNRAFAGGGPVLGLLVVALEAVVVLVGVVLVVRALHRVLLSGVSRPRFLVVCATLLASIAAVGAVLPVSVSATAGFTVRDDRVILVQAEGADRIGLPEGGRVVLVSNGILGNEEVGDGEVVRRPPAPAEVPLDALFPMTADGVAIPAVIIAEVERSTDGRELPATGQARIDLGTSSLWAAIWNAGVVSPLSALQSDEKEKQ